MEKIVISGKIISGEHLSWHTVKLEQPNGYKIDLISRVIECIDSYPNKKIQLSYYISDNECTLDEAIEGHLNFVMGNITADYETNHYSYSEYTSGTDYDSILQIDSHNLLNELYAHIDKHLIICLTITDR